MNNEKRLMIRNRLKRYYKRKFIKWMRKVNRIVQGKINEQVKSKKSNNLLNVRKQLVQIMSQQQFIAYVQSLPLNTTLKPVLINLTQPLKYTYPQKLIIRVAKSITNNVNRNQLNQQIDEITCTNGDESDDVVFLQVDKQQFLIKRSQMMNNKKSNNKKKHNNCNNHQHQELFSISVPQMQLLKQSYQQPQLVNKYFNIKEKSNLYSVNLWHYITHTITKLHYDAHDNFLFQLKGVKNILLKQPNTIDSYCNSSQNNRIREYVGRNNVFGINSNHSHSHNKSIPSLQRISIQLNSRECLFIPRGWFHEVQSLVDQQQGDNIAINFWGNTIQSYNIPQQQIQINLKQLIYRVSQSICSNKVKQWSDLQQSMKQQYRQAYFSQYMNTLICGNNVGYK